jgi:MFS family permease
MLKDNRKRSLLALALMIGQSFFYNSVFFTYGLVLDKFFKVSAQRVPSHLLPLALSNFVGPLVLGKFFDSVGRKPMIIATYGMAGILLAATAIPFGLGALTATTLGVCFAAIFFIASSAASSAYLTVSEVFPLEIRAFAIAIFYAIGTLIGGVGAPILFGELIASGSRWNVALGYLVGAVLMIAGAITEWAFGVEAERKSLEAISQPIQSQS